MTETALAELLAADLSGLDLVALMIDGALRRASTSTGTSTRSRWWRARRRTRRWSPICWWTCVVGGLDVTRPMLVGLDGSKALFRAVQGVLDHPVIQRCQLYKTRMVKDHLPQHLRSSVGRKMTDAYHASALEAKAALLALAKELDSTHPEAAASLRNVTLAVAFRRLTQCRSANSDRTAWRSLYYETAIEKRS